MTGRDLQWNGMERTRPDQTSKGTEWNVDAQKRKGLEMIGIDLLWHGEDWNRTAMQWSRDDS